MRYARVEGVFIVVHSRTPPTDEEWNASLHDIPHAEPGRPWVPVLVRAETGPNVMQRARLNLAMRGRRIRTACLSDSEFVRGIIMALQWMGAQDTRGFELTAVDDALEHLGVPPEHRPAVLEALREMETALGLDPS
jgi:hypothetical protein